MPPGRGGCAPAHGGLHKSGVLQGHGGAHGGKVSPAGWMVPGLRDPRGVRGGPREPG